MNWLEIAINFGTTIVGVTIGSYIGVWIMQRRLKSIVNELLAEENISEIVDRVKDMVSAIEGTLEKFGVVKQ